MKKCWDKMNLPILRGFPYLPVTGAQIRRNPLYILSAYVYHGLVYTVKSNGFINLNL